MSDKLIKVGVAGATGYTGRELILRLARHANVELIALAHGPSSPDQPITAIFPELNGICDLMVESCQALIDNNELDAVFLALPHRAAMAVAKPLLLKGIRIVDFSADYRLRDIDTYEKWYKVKHSDHANLKHAVYGLCEHYRDEIRPAKLVASPGCYPTSALLPLIPLAKAGIIDLTSIIIDAKSGASGAGKKMSAALQFVEVNQSFKAYGLFNHRHIPEIVQELSRASKQEAKIIFTPHLLPIERGILSTIYVDLKKDITADEIRQIWNQQYCNDFFVRVKNDPVELKHVNNTNFCDICCFVEGSKAILVSVIDNLVKGASGQALQAFNLMYGFDERAGLI